MNRATAFLGVDVGGTFTDVVLGDGAGNFEVDERIDAAGAVVRALGAAQAHALAERVAAAQPEAVAICLIHAYANPEHERRLAQACRSALPDAFVVASCEVWPERREYERALTTVMCAVVGPQMAGYLAGFESLARALGIRAPLQVMDSSGGVMSAARAARVPIYTVESGGAAGVVAGGFFGGLRGAREVISFDMGGTTAKAGVVRDGRPGVTHAFHVGGIASLSGRKGGEGFPVKIPVVDIAEVGAGGGSIAWVDEGAALRVGPRSAGADPGPAAYDRGGLDPTVTDADLVLGYLNPERLAGGVSLAPERSREAIERRVARPLGLDVAAAARGIHDIANLHMAAAIRVVTIQRGIDPRDFTLIGFGGAGPMHLARLAEAFSITSAVVPGAAGVASALGLLASDPSAESVRTHLMDESDADPREIERVFAALEAEAARELGAGEGEALGVARAVAKLELVARRGRVEDGADSARSARIGERSAFFVERGAFAPTPVYAWQRLAPHARIAGPAIVEGLDTTLVIPPRWSAQIDAYGNALLETGAAEG